MVELFHHSAGQESAGTVLTFGQQLAEVRQTAVAVFWGTVVEVALLVAVVGAGWLW